MQEKNMIFLKKKHVIPKQGEGGGSPIWEKFPHFPVFFLGASLNKVQIYMEPNSSDALSAISHRLATAVAHLLFYNRPKKRSFF